MPTISDIFEEMWKIICFISKADTIHVVYDSNIEGSIKDCERVRHAQETEPLEFINLMRNSPLTVQFNCFWVCPKNKENIQIISRKYFIERAAEQNKRNCLEQLRHRCGGNCKLRSNT